MDRPYLLDTYQFRHTSRIIRLGHTRDGKQWVVLSETIFHPRGGGQPEDRGTIKGIPVRDVYYLNGEIAHIIDGTPPPIGNDVALVIDADWRIRHARLHTAGHLLGNIFSSTAPNLTQTKAYHGDGDAYLEYSLPHPLDVKTVVGRLNDRLEQDISADLPVRIWSREYRTISIGDYPGQSCAGTHIASTRELSGTRFTEISYRQESLRLSYSI